MTGLLGELTAGDRDQFLTWFHLTLGYRPGICVLAREIRPAGVAEENLDAPLPPTP